ncbi:MAG: DinB family protein [Gordonia sp. (in: high G+C Gram-positive bacteria)]
MPHVDPAKAALHSQLNSARDAVLWKLADLSEYDMRRPITATGTNLLGLVKHLSGCEMGYFGVVFNRPFSDPPDWLSEPSSDPSRDMWATADETSAEIIALYRRAREHSDETIDGLRLDARGEIPGPPSAGPRSVTLHDVLVHMVAETARHAGHADILRELIDQSVGTGESTRNMPEVPEEYWPKLVERIEQHAREADARAKPSG